jgi:hypothetical protein
MLDRAIAVAEEAAQSDEDLLTEDEVSRRYRGCISVGTLRNWRARRIGPSYVKVGKAVLYQLGVLKDWDRKNTVSCSKI